MQRQMKGSAFLGSCPIQASGVSLAYGYDLNRRSVRVEWQDEGAEPLVHYVNQYNAANSKTQEIRRHMSRGDTYGIDKSYRLTTFNRDAALSGDTLTPVSGQDSTWTLDGANNWSAYTQQGTNRSPVVDVAGGVNEYSSFDGKSLSYDSNGNLKDDGVNLYKYDAKNRLVEVVRKGTSGAPNYTLATYLYALDNQRVLKSVSPDASTAPVGAQKQIRFAYDGWQIIEERVDTQVSGSPYNKVIRQYAVGPMMDQYLQMISYDGVSQSPVEAFYYHANAMGSTGCLTDSSGMPQSFVEYDAYGQPKFWDASKTTVVASEPFGNPILFDSMYFDTETGFYWVRNRTLAPKMGRFLQADPIGNHNWHDAYNFGNRYTMVGNRAGDLLDPNGHCSAVERAKERLEEKSRFEKESAQRKHGIRTPSSTPPFDKIAYLCTKYGLVGGKFICFKIGRADCPEGPAVLIAEIPGKILIGALTCNQVRAHLNIRPAIY